MAMRIASVGMVTQISGAVRFFAGLCFTRALLRALGFGVGLIQAGRVTEQAGVRSRMRPVPMRAPVAAADRWLCLWLFAELRSTLLFPWAPGSSAGSSRAGRVVRHAGVRGRKRPVLMRTSEPTTGRWLWLWTGLYIN